MIQDVLRSIEGVEVFPLIAMFLLLGGFLAIIMIAFRMKKSVVEYASRLPLDDGTVLASAEHETGSAKADDGVQ